MSRRQRKAGKKRIIAKKGGFQNGVADGSFFLSLFIIQS
jgi:hypothetical protein